MAKFWLIKTEPEVYSIDDLARDKKTLWGNVRNYQARNFMRDEWRVGDQLLFYHSNSTPSGIVGIAEVSRTGIPDPSQFDKSSEYYDPKATKEEPRWIAPEIRFKEKFKALLAIDQLRKESSLVGMVLLQRGSRLSIQPVSGAEAKTVLKLAKR